jgi:hypothetical protein
MKEKKTRKITCNVTGRILFASKSYYAKKVEKAGSEDILHKTYICREAKQLLKKGHELTYIRDTLDVDLDFKTQLSESEIKEIVCTNDPGLKMRLNNCDNTQLGVIKTDPDVKQFIKNILSDGT